MRVNAAGLRYLGCGHPTPGHGILQLTSRHPSSEGGVRATLIQAQQLRHTPTV